MKVAVFVAIFAVKMAAAQIAHNKIVACYWGAWSFYRTGLGQFDVNDIDPNLCTHGFYGFADVDNTTWTLKVIDPWYDLGPNDCDLGDAECHFNTYRRFVGLKDKNPNFKPMISIGGWNAGSQAFSIMAADPHKRMTFINSVMDFLRKFKFDGVDLDWEYPGSREGSDPENDKQNFNILITELSAALKPKNYLFSAAVSPGKPTIDIAYDIAYMSTKFDFINVMCYDYHGWWDGHSFTGHNSPLDGRLGDDYLDDKFWYFNVQDTIKVYLDNGAPRDKLVVGIPAYGRGFRLADPEDTGLYCDADGGIPAGPYTRQDGIWGYQEIMQAFNNDTLVNLPGAQPKRWTVVVDECYKAPFAYNGPYWIGYDDVESVSYKAKFINYMGLAGAMLWSVDTDDFRGDYGNQPFPILRTINDVLASNESYDPGSFCRGSARMCGGDVTTTVDPTPTPTTTPPTETTTPPTEITTPPTETTTPYIPDTTTEPFAHCTEDHETLPYPGNCHLYFKCSANSNGGFEAHVFNCGEMIFDPNVHACVEANHGAEQNLC